MGIQRSVWTLGECNITIYEEDGAGNLQYNTPGDPLSGLKPALYQYCFAEDVNIFASTSQRRRGVTGRGFRKLVNQSQTYDEVTATIGHMFFRKAAELNFSENFNVNKQLRFMFEWYKLEYTNVAPFENDSFRLSYARSRSFNIKSRMPEIVTATIEIDAELIL